VGSTDPQSRLVCSSCRGESLCEVQVCLFSRGEGERKLCPTSSFWVGDSYLLFTAAAFFETSWVPPGPCFPNCGCHDWKEYLRMKRKERKGKLCEDVYTIFKQRRVQRPAWKREMRAN